MRFLLLAILLLVCGVLLGREVLLVGAARRSGGDPVPLYRRLRRRAKGLALLVLLYLFAAFYDSVISTFHFGPREQFLYVGMAVIAMFWLLILAGRDLKESALEAVAERRRLTHETMREIEKEIEKRRTRK